MSVGRLPWGNNAIDVILETLWMHSSHETTTVSPRSHWVNCEVPQNLQYSRATTNNLVCCWFICWSTSLRKVTRWWNMVIVSLSLRSLNVLFYPTNYLKPKYIQFTIIYNRVYPACMFFVFCLRNRLSKQLHLNFTDGDRVSWLLISLLWLIQAACISPKLGESSHLKSTQPLLYKKSLIRQAYDN